MKKAIGLLLVSIIASSCITLDGNLDVKETLTAKKKAGFLNLKTKIITINPGLYKAELKVNNQNNFSLKLESGEDKINLPIISKEDVKIPANGDFKVASAQIEQPFDVAGSITTDITYSDRFREMESCTITREERQCRRICEANRCEPVCEVVTISYPGRRPVEYHYRYTERNITVNLQKASEERSLATFTGRHNDTDRITDFTGICR